jgi:hypothetical protein
VIHGEGASSGSSPASITGQQFCDWVAVGSQTGASGTTGAATASSSGPASSRTTEVTRTTSRVTTVSAPISSTRRPRGVIRSVPCWVTGRPAGEPAGRRGRSVPGVPCGPGPGPVERGPADPDVVDRGCVDRACPGPEGAVPERPGPEGPVRTGIARGASGSTGRPAGRVRVGAGSSSGRWGRTTSSVERAGAPDRDFCRPGCSRVVRAGRQDRKECASSGNCPPRTSEA